MIEGGERWVYRYSQEIEGIGKVWANDLDPAAVDAIEANKLLNPDGADKVVASLGDATTLMYQRRGPGDEERFEVSRLYHGVTADLTVSVGGRSRSVWIASHLSRFSGTVCE